MKDDDGNKVKEYFKRFHISLEKAYYKYCNKEQLNKYEKLLVIMQLNDIKEIEKLSKGDKDLELLVHYISDMSHEPAVVDVYCKEQMQEEMLELAEEQGKISCKIDIAKIMIKDDVPLENVIKYTNLALEKLKQESN